MRHPLDVAVDERQAALRRMQGQETVPDKLARARAWLRERGLYCFDIKVDRVPKKETLTVLDRWVRSNARR